jgi:hypothetical protein
VLAYVFWHPGRPDADRPTPEFCLLTVGEPSLPPGIAADVLGLEPV